MMMEIIGSIESNTTSEGFRMWCLAGSEQWCSLTLAPILDTQRLEISGHCMRRGQQLRDSCQSSSLSTLLGAKMGSCYQSLSEHISYCLPCLWRIILLGVTAPFWLMNHPNPSKSFGDSICCFFCLMNSQTYIPQTCIQYSILYILSMQTGISWADGPFALSKKCCIATN